MNYANYCTANCRHPTRHLLSRETLEPKDTQWTLTKEGIIVYWRAYCHGQARTYVSDSQVPTLRQWPLADDGLYRIVYFWPLSAFFATLFDAAFCLFGSLNSLSVPSVVCGFAQLVGFVGASIVRWWRSATQRHIGCIYYRLEDRGIEAAVDSVRVCVCACVRSRKRIIKNRGREESITAMMMS